MFWKLQAYFNKKAYYACVLKNFINSYTVTKCIANEDINNYWNSTMYIYEKIYSINRKDHP